MSNPIHPYLNTKPPCDCGNQHASWYGDPQGLRVYRCDPCNRIENAIAFLRSSHVQDNKHRLGCLGAQDIDNALASLLNPGTKSD